VITNGTSNTVDVTTIIGAVGTGDQGEEIRFTFATAPSLSASSTYYIFIRSNMTVSGTDHLMIHSSLIGPLTAADFGNGWTYDQDTTWTEITNRSYAFRVCTSDEHPEIARFYQSASGQITATKTAGADRLCLSLTLCNDDRTFSDDATNYDLLWQGNSAVGVGFSLCAFQYRKATAGSVAADSFTIDQTEIHHTSVIALKPRVPLVLQGAIAAQSTVAGDVRFVGYPNYKGHGGVGTDTGHNVDVPLPTPVKAGDILVALLGDEDNDEFGWPRAATPNKNLFTDSSFRGGIHWWETRGSPVPSKSWSRDQAFDGNESLRADLSTSLYSGIDHARGPVPVAGSTQYTFSFYLRNGNGSVNYDFIVMDQDENTIQSSTNQSSTQDTWVRHEVTFTTGSDDTGAGIAIRKSNDATVVTIYVDAIQLETGASATAYLESAASDWTRRDFTNDHSAFSPAWFWLRADGTETGNVRFPSAVDIGEVLGGVIFRFDNCAAQGDPFENDAVAEFFKNIDSFQIHYNTTTGYEKANEWVPSSSTVIDSVMCLMKRVGSPTGNVWCEIWDESGGEPNAAITNGTSGNVDVTTIPGILNGSYPGGLIQFDFATPPTLVGGQTYFFVIRSNITVSTTNYLTVARAWENGIFDAWNRTQAGAWTEDATRSLNMRVAQRDSYPNAAPLDLGTTATIRALETYGGRRLIAALIAIEDDVGTSDDATNYDQIEDLTTAVGNGMGFALFTQRKASAGSVAADSCTVGGSDYWQSFVLALRGPTDVLAGAIAAQSTVTGNLEIAGGVTYQLQGAIASQSTVTGDLAVTRKLAGSIAAQSAVTGTLSLTQRVVGAIAAQSAVVGDLEAIRQLAGSIDAQSTVTGDLVRVKNLAGTIGAQSTVSGAITQTHALAETIAAQSTVTGDLAAIRELAGTIAAQSVVTGDLVRVKNLAGSITAQSGVTGALTLTQSVAGSIAAQSTVTGNLEIVEPTWTLDGHIAAQSTVAGDLEQTRALVGSIAAQSAVAGDLLVTRKVAGTIAAQSDVAGTLSQTWKTSGTIAAQSTVAGALGQIWTTAGAIAAQSTVLGSLTHVEAEWPLAGHIQAQSTVSGTIIQQHTLVGPIAAQSAVAGDLKVTRKVAGTIAAQSALAGDLQFAAFVLEGTIAAQSTVAGDLQAIRQLAGTIAAQSDVSGTLTLQQALVGPIAAQSTVAGDLKVTRKVAGAVAGQSTLLGDLTLVEALWSLEGTVAAVSTVSGDLAVTRKLAGSISAQSDVSGTLALDQALVGAIAATSTVAGDLLVTREITGTIAAQSSVVGDLTLLAGAQPLEGTIAAQSTVTGDLQAVRELAGAIAAVSTVTGDLLVTRELAGSVAAQSVVTGDLSLVEALWSLQGSIDAQSTVTGDLTQTRALAGQIAAQSDVVGALAQQHTLAGVIAAQSVVDGTLSILTTLQGQIAAQAIVLGDLAIVEALHQLQGQIAAQSTVVGVLTPTRALAGVVAAQSDVAGTLIATYAVSGVVAAQSSLYGRLLPTDISRLVQKIGPGVVIEGRQNLAMPPREDLEIPSRRNLEVDGE
jgi:hypothetical protein